MAQRRKNNWRTAALLVAGLLLITLVWMIYTWSGNPDPEDLGPEAGASLDEG